MSNLLTTRYEVAEATAMFYKEVPSKVVTKRKLCFKMAVEQPKAIFRNLAQEFKVLDASWSRMGGVCGKTHLGSLLAKISFTINTIMLVALIFFKHLIAGLFHPAVSIRPDRLNSITA